MGLSAWGVCIAFSQFSHLDIIYTGLSPVIGLINVEFLFGVFISCIAGRRLNIPASILIVLCLAFFIFWIILGADRSNSYLFGVAIAAAVLMFVQWEQSGKIHVPRWLAFLGDSSYGVYLVHGLIISGLIRFCASVEFLQGYGSAMIILIIGSIIGGIAYYLFIERPALRYMRRRFIKAQA